MGLTSGTRLALSILIAIQLMSLGGCEGYHQDSITLRYVRGITANDSVSITGNAGNAVTRVGAYFLISNSENPGEIQVLDSAGAFVRSFGRQGEGPEEFQDVRDMTAAADGSLWVLDSGNSRLSHFSLGLDYVGDHRISLRPPTARGYGLETLANGDLLLLGCLGSRENCGAHRWNESGVVWSAPLQSKSGGNLQVAAEAPDGTLWVAKQSTYELWELSSGGSVLRSVQLSPKWWTDWQVQRQASGSPPAEALEQGGPAGAWSTKARVFDILCTDTHLFILGGTGDARWREARSEGFFDLEKSHDSVVEVLDRKTLEVVASGVFDIPNGVLKTFLSPTLVLAEETHEIFDALGLWELEIGISEAGSMD